VLLFLAVVAVLVVSLALRATRVIIYDYQKGLLYRKGTFVKLLGAGRYRLWRPATSIQVVDIRRTLLSVPGQDILTKDNVSVKLSVSGFFEMTDPVKARHQSQNYVTELYAHVQLALRDLIALHTIDELLEKKAEIDAQLLARAVDKAAALGLTISSLAVRDIVLPAALKKAFSGILEAKKDAQKQLEKARGEQAVLRNLANASSLFEGNPMLLQARLIQQLSAGNNTVVFNASDRETVVPKKAG
jgi:regulator of protease activity HflC (stomatin/prohibitin superfamily)